MTESMRLLERNYIMDILLMLRKEEGLCITDLCLTDYGINGTRYRRIAELEGAGLIEVRRKSCECHNRKSMYLTEKGRRVAEALAVIEEVMS